MHLFGDLFTPAGSWGGIQLLYPLDTYFGGWGVLWWWNNYDIFLLLFLTLTVNLISLASFSMLSLAGRWLPIIILGCGLLLMGVQIKQRHFNYNQPGYLNREAASLSFQRSMLSPRVYRTMLRLDQRMPVYF
jgi:inner membrane protein